MECYSEIKTTNYSCSNMDKSKNYAEWKKLDTNYILNGYIYIYFFLFFLVFSFSYRRPGGSQLTPAPPQGTRGAHARGPRPLPAPRPPGSPLPTAAAGRTSGARRPGPVGEGGESGVWGRREGPPDSPRARPPQPQGGRATRHGSLNHRAGRR